ncbi:hypothetical protein HELRODRAFT_182512 [Helobdella robusta]|uniref:Uncharacterized protein n=1 Tax=Helobdella robusta TaxID=6412 RepID=T1FIA8_HELRO|nr:hypothetical protein HELRODRAFT_182512 [Helobdella robusta]ESN90921.1 hypothetical protein HELRODRAFT_182512 [Helobdella robusta]
MSLDDSCIDLKLIYNDLKVSMDFSKDHILNHSKCLGFLHLHIVQYLKKALKRAEASLRENENESNRLKAKLGNSEHAMEDYKIELSKHKLEIERLRQELLNSKLDKDAEYNKSIYFY